MVGPDRVRVSGEDLGELCRRHRIRRLSLFGSVLREDFSAACDVDVLVEFETRARVTFFSLARLEAALSALFGRPADVNVPRSLSPHLRDRVLSQAQDFYVEPVLAELG
jgi:hypothetical protein